ncbi:MAG: LptF/LptG family permease [Planctomycetota bacterium]|nr:LptF/LptG family permease [Planctomycetota bacterium]MEE3297054.1 LptF/LptG family permease [Planctomycetota bacterium]
MEAHSTEVTLEVKPGLAEPATAPFSQYGREDWRIRRRRVPWTIGKYVGMEAIRTVVLCILLISLLYCAMVTFQTIRSGIQFAFIWPFLIKTFAYPLFFSLPLALLAGVTLAYGRMTADLEVAAIRYHGASHLQMFGPVLVLAMACGGLGHYLNGWIIPEIHFEKNNLQQYIIRQLESLGSGVNRTILLPEGSGSLFVGQYNGTDLNRVQIDMHRDLQSTFVPQVRNQLPQQLPETVTLLAVQGRIEITPDRRGVNLHLRGVEILIPEHISGTKSGKDSFIQKFSISESITIPLSFQSRQRKLKDLQNSELNSRIDEIEKRIAIGPGKPGLGRELRLALGERHRRNAFSLSGVTFPLLGAALCFMASFTSRLVPFFMSTIIVLVTFYPLLMVGTYLARSTDIQPILALAIPNAALILVTAVFLQKVVRK